MASLNHPSKLLPRSSITKMATIYANTYLANLHITSKHTCSTNCKKKKHKETCNRNKYTLDLDIIEPRDKQTYHLIRGRKPWWRPPHPPMRNCNSHCLFYSRLQCRAWISHHWRPCPSSHWNRKQKLCRNGTSKLPF